MQGVRKRKCILYVLCVVLYFVCAQIVVKANILEDPLEIVQQPKDIYAMDGELVSTSVEVKGDNLSYQWWVSTSATAKFYPSSIKNATYKTRMSLDRDGRRIYCIITDSYGNKKKTDIVTLHIQKLSITKQPENMYGEIGDLISTSVEVNQKDVTYQWWVDVLGNGKFYTSSIKNSIYKTRMSEDRIGRRVYCVISDKNGNSVTSDIVTCCRNIACNSHTFSEEEPDCKIDGGYRFKKSCLHCDAIEYVYYDALVTFVDDDAKADALVHWEHIMDETGIKVSSAVIPSKVKAKTDYEGYYSYAGWDLIHRLKAKGMDFVNHTYQHINLKKLTEEEIHADLKKAKEELSKNGIESDILVYPNNAYNETVLKVVPKYFKAAVTCGGVSNKYPLNNVYAINRVEINDNSNNRRIDFGSVTVECRGVRTITNLKKYVDNAVKKDAWLVFMSHAYNSPGGKTYFDEECEQTIIDLCRYIQGLGNVKVVTLTEGVEIVTNK